MLRGNQNRALKGFVHIRGEAAQTLIIPAKGMHMWGTEEPGKILPQIFKAGGKCGFRLGIGLILPSFLPQLQSCIKQAVMQMFLFG